MWRLVTFPHGAQPQGSKITNYCSFCRQSSIKNFLQGEIRLPDAAAVPGGADSRDAAKPGAARPAGRGFVLEEVKAKKQLS